MNRRKFLIGCAACALILGLARPGWATVIGATVGTSSGQVLAAPTAAPRHFVEINNESATATIACAFGATAALNSAGSYTIAAGATMIWNGALYRSFDAINCISSAASTPVTVEYQ